MSSTPTTDRAPIFLFGFERSGTTLLSMMVGAHPEIAVPLSATGLWYHYARALDRYGNLGERANLERLVDDLLREERIMLWDVAIDRAEVLRDLRGSYPAVVARFHALYAAAKGKSRPGNIDIATLDEMDLANAWFPDARFVHIVRDGRDVALSHATMPYGAANTVECAERWWHRLRVNLKMGAILGPGRYHVVRFEDLILDSQPTLERLCRFLDVPYSPAMLEYPRMVPEKIPPDKRWLWPALDKPPDSTRVFGWKKKMSAYRRAAFENAAGDLLRELGYATAGQVSGSPLRHAYELWCFLGRGGRFRRAAAKIGLQRSSKLERAAQSQADVQKQAFGDLVRSGTYDEDFRHSDAAVSFFRASMTEAMRDLNGRGRVAALDCGCGPGAWLEALATEVEQTGPDRLEAFGFDITPEMAEVARRRLDARPAPAHIAQGDILDPAAYEFGEPDRVFQLVYAYDVIQQLPRKLQLTACRTMLKRLARGGAAVVFDHDCHSPFGRSMGFKKFLTQYLGIGLVPRYYCNARYPALARFARDLAASGEFQTQIRVAADQRKRALIVRRIRGEVSGENASAATTQTPH